MAERMNVPPRQRRKSEMAAVSVASSARKSSIYGNRLRKCNNIAFRLGEQGSDATQSASAHPTSDARK